MKKIITIVTVIILAILGVIALSHKYLPQVMADLALSHFLGVQVTTETVSLNTSKGDMYIKDLKIYNPPDFGKLKLLAHLPEIKADFNFSFFRKKKIYIKRLEVTLDTLLVIKNKDGKLNIDSLNMPSFQKDLIPVKRLILTVNEVIYSDYTRGAKPRLQSYDVNIKEQAYDDIPGVHEVVTKILVESLSRTAIKGALIYGAASMAGISLTGPVALPIGATMIFTGKDSRKAIFEATYDKVFKAALSTLKDMSASVYENKEIGVIRASVDNSNVKLKITEEKDDKVTVAISARKYFIPRPKIAGGILYQIAQEINEQD